jgi:hypothetical protein
VIDPPDEIEPRLFGKQQTAATIGAVRSLRRSKALRRMGGLRPRKRRHHRFSPKNPSPNPHGEACMWAWRDRDGGMKVLWLRQSGAQGSHAQRATLSKSRIWCRSARNWYGQTARSLRFSNWNRVRALETSRERTAPRRRRAPPMRRGGWCGPDRCHDCCCLPRRATPKSAKINPGIMVSPQGFEPWTP